MNSQCYLIRTKSKLVNYNLEAFKIKKKTSGVITHVSDTEVYREADLWVVHGFPKGRKGWARHLLNKANISMLMTIFIKLSIYSVI